MNAVASRIVGGVAFAARHPGTQRVTVTLEISSTAQFDELNEAVTSMLAGQEHHYQCEMDDGTEVDVEFAIVSAETDSCRVDAGVPA